MIILHNQRIFETAAKDPGRYSMNAVRLRELDGNVVAEATDGKCLARVELQLEDGEELAEEVMLDARQLKAGWGRGKSDRILACNVEGQWTLRVGSQVTAIDTIDGEFPRIDDVVPASSKDRRVTLNLDLLVSTAKALGVTEVTLELPELEDGQVMGAVRVSSRESFSEAAVGVVMPITFS